MNGIDITDLLNEFLNFLRRFLKYKNLVDQEYNVLEKNTQTKQEKQVSIKNTKPMSYC